MYKAVVAKIHLRPHPNADKLQIGDVLGYQVVVDKKHYQENDLVVFFAADGQLSEEFATKNDLIRRKDEFGNDVGGYFENNRRVKSIKLRGARSDGFVSNLDLFKYTDFDLSTLKEGDQFDELNKHPICNKYYTPATLRSMAGEKLKGLKNPDNIMFAKHVETHQFKHEAKMIPKGSHIVCTYKMHGTSHRFGYVSDSKVLKGISRFKQGLVNLLSGKSWSEPKYEWTMLNGTRNVTLRVPEQDKFYEGDPFRFNATRGLNLHKGEVIYCELVGYSETGKPIMAEHSADNLKDKEFVKKFGRVVTYSYGCLDKQCDLYVYRITRVNEDGQAIDLSWNQIKQRCQQLNIKYVPEIREFIYDGNVEALIFSVDLMTNGPSGHDAIVDPVGKTHPIEGIVLRVENERGILFLKSKSWVFSVMEGFKKNDESYVDAEETS